MFKKLRIKFIGIIMASVALVLAVTFTILCYSEYQREMNDVNEALSSAIDRAANMAQRPDQGFAGDQERSGAENGLSSSSQDKGSQKHDRTKQADDFDAGQEGYGGINQRIGGRDQGPGNLVPVAVYTLSSDGELVFAEGVATATISETVLESASQHIVTVDAGTGTLDDLGLHYEKRTVETTVYIAFADASSSSSWQSLALRLVVAAVIVLAIFFVLSLLFSKWALRPVKDAWDAQRQFVADASHELKTPLTVILANASILLKHPDDTVASQSKWVESTQAEANTMHELVNEMLELAQVEERAQIELDDLDLSDLVDTEALQFESVAFERGCTFDYDIAPDICITGNEPRLKKMVSTLIENALKYVDDEGAVRIELTHVNRNAVLAISNTGSFISAEDLPHIFDRFYRTDKARTSGQGGFGLGLAIARETARAHGGDITCKSDKSSGTTFTVTLPLA